MRIVEGRRSIADAEVELRESSCANFFEIVNLCVAFVVSVLCTLTLLVQMLLLQLLVQVVEVADAAVEAASPAVVVVLIRLDVPQVERQGCHRLLLLLLLVVTARGHGRRHGRHRGRPLRDRYDNMTRRTSSIPPNKKRHKRTTEKYDVNKNTAKPADVPELLLPSEQP